MEHHLKIGLERSDDVPKREKSQLCGKYTKRIIVGRIHWIRTNTGSSQSPRAKPLNTSTLYKEGGLL